MAPQVICHHEDGDEDGTKRRCNCPKFTGRPDQDPNLPVLCRDCGHTKSWHEGDELAKNVQNILKSCTTKLHDMRRRPDSVLADAEANAGRMNWKVRQSPS